MEQAQNETVDQFVSRLRQQYGFDNVDEAIRDQVIEKCRSIHLRREFLEKSGNILLKDFQDVAFEAVDLQMKATENPGASTDAQVNAVNKNKPKWKGKGKYSVTGRTSPHRQTEQRCYLCNRRGHFARDAQCPARDQVCKQCGKRGHYAVCCKTQGFGKPKWKPVIPRTQK